MRQTVVLPFSQPGFAGICLAIAVPCLIFPLNLPAAKKFQLKQAPPAGAIQQVEVQLRVNGQLKLNADGKEVKRLPLAVEGNLLYDETLRSATGTLRAVRYYRAAEATIRVGDNKLTPRLAKDRRLVVVHDVENRKPTLLSPRQHLTRDDLDLIDVPGNTALLGHLLPDDARQIGDKWEHPTRTAELLFGLEAVSSADLVSSLTDVQGSEATISLQGTIQGAVGGVSSDLEVRGNFSFDLQKSLITRLAVTIEENRAVGHASPGFEVSAHLQVKRTPTTRRDHVDPDAISDITNEILDGQDLLQFISESGGFRMLHDRRWQVMVDQTNVTILRLIDRGDLVAQCNLSQLTDLPAGQHLKLEQFESDIKTSLGEEFGQFVESSQAENELGYRVLRVVAVGIVSKLPIQWTYYHISDDSGRRMSYVVTMEGKYVDRFAAADLALASSLEFLARPSTSSSDSHETSTRPGLNRQQLRR